MGVSMVRLRPFAIPTSLFQGIPAEPYQHILILCTQFNAQTDRQTDFNSTGIIICVKYCIKIGMSRIFANLLLLFGK